MTKILQSKLAAWLAMAIVIIVIAVTFKFRPAWWAFFDLFFAFMMVFCQLAALYLGPLNLYVKKRMQQSAAVCGILMILSFIAEYIVYTVLYT